IPERASTIRVLMMELTRISSHLVALGTGGMEMGATTVMTVGFRERERVLRGIEMITGLRMNNAYIRPGGAAQPLPRAADVVTRDTCDAYGRIRIRIDEMYQSLRIIEQATDRLQADEPGAPVMVADRKIAWPAQLAISGDGMGNSLDHIRNIMGESMEGLI